ncbi:alkaline phosphatase family protein [Microbacterium sp.]|uniref:alkaline phosphatase family protein n=1 Tax=Microbacterium sp. TaxID=51671 RepID=UPI0039E5BF04
MATGADGGSGDGAPADPGRREFLRRTGIGVAGLAVGGGAAFGIATAIGAQHSPEPGFSPLPERPEPGFDHLVVLMFENRSFDNVLGRLYSAQEKSRTQFDGLGQGDYSNPGPDGARIPAHVYTGSTDSIMQQPQPDPGETYPHVNTQLFDIERPPVNAPSAAAKPTNEGFVHDYITNFRESEGREPTAAEYRVAMGGFAPEMLPVMSTLAREFAVYDRWFAAVPSQTYCNRSFFHASTSHGFVVNHTDGSYEKWLHAPASPTIFDRLEDAGIPWRVYYDPTQLVSLTGFIHAPALEKYWKTNFRDMTQFSADAAAGTLPAYSFIEPRMIFNHNDMHPPWGELRGGTLTLEDGTTVQIDSSAISDVRAGDKLLQDVYDAIRTSASPTGSNAINTTLVVTFDEHGGIFDHVAPPAATPPDDAGPGEMGFGFDRLGPRVPAIVISAYTAAGTVVHDEMHHGAVIATLCRQHGLAPLTARDAGARAIDNALTLTAPRQPGTWPQPTALWAPPNPEAVADDTADAHRARPLTSPARGLLGLLLEYRNPRAKAPTTYGEAYDVLQEDGHGLFGTTDAAAGD